MVSNKINNYQDIIRECFLEDEELTSIWHINAGLGSESCINRTIDEINQAGDNLKFFVIKNDKDILGFYGTELDCYLTTFFVKPRYRKKEYMKDIWEIMIKDLPKTFHSSLHVKNTKAIDFFKKNGGSVYSTIIHNNEPVLMFIFNKEKY